MRANLSVADPRSACRLGIPTAHQAPQVGAAWGSCWMMDNVDATIFTPLHPAGYIFTAVVTFTLIQA